MSRNNYAEFVITNVRPSNYNTVDFNKGDCTTRSMCYCLNAIGVNMSYTEIEAEQYKIGKVRGTPRNATGTWDKVLTNRGFSWVQLNTQKNRAIVANILHTIDNPMVTISSGHACAIHKGKVLDTWDSRGGKVFGLLLKDEDIEMTMDILNKYGIECEKVEIPKRTIKRRRRRSYWW